MAHHQDKASDEIHTDKSETKHVDTVGTEQRPDEEEDPEDDRMTWRTYAGILSGQGAFGTQAGAHNGGVGLPGPHAAGLSSVERHNTIINAAS